MKHPPEATFTIPSTETIDTAYLLGTVDPEGGSCRHVFGTWTLASMDPGLT